MMADPTFSAEPLAELARLAFDHAAEWCSPDRGCESYHRSWSLMRLMDLAGELPAGLEFLKRELPPAARGAKVKVLIAGAADSGLAALVLAALHPRGIEPEILVVDRCETPLAQNRLFAKAVAARIATLRADVADLEPSAFDAVVLHNVLFFVPPAERPRFLAGTARTLRPGGRLLCVQRLQDGPAAPLARKQAAATDPGDIRTAQAAADAGFGGGDALCVARALDDFRSFDSPRWTLSGQDLLKLLSEVGFDRVEISPLESGTAASPRAKAGKSGSGHRAGILALMP